MRFAGELPQEFLASFFLFCLRAAARTAEPDLFPPHISHFLLDLLSARYALFPPCAPLLAVGAALRCFSIPVPAAAPILLPPSFFSDAALRPPLPFSLSYFFAH